jgi:nucleotide-binding universal stress UspA family protein
MGGGAAGQGEPERAYEPRVERFGPRPKSGSTILVGVDGLARRQSYRLLVAFVAERSTLTLTGAAAAFEHGTQCELHAELGAQIRAGADELGVPVTFVMVHGDPFTALRDAADCCHADTVVVGASTSAGHRFAGSVATRLIRASRWPVVVVP